jgi:uncharacterized protein
MSAGRPHRNDPREAIAPQVWIIDTAYTGERNARIGVAERLGYPYEFVPPPESPGTGYALAHWHRYASASHRGRKPLIVLSGTGEETISPVADLGACFRDRLLNVFLASILPEMPDPRLHDYDLVASPQLAGNDIVTTVGVPHRITDAALEAAFREHHELFSGLTRPILGVLVGGNTRYCKGFDEAYAIRLGRRVARIARSVNGRIVVTNSRRTPDDALAALLRELADLGCLFIDWQHGSGTRYPAILAACDFFVATGDSLSMCSEVSFTGKPVLIALDDDATESFHREIIGKLIRSGAARVLGEHYAPWRYQAPDPTGVVAAAIRTRMAEKWGAAGSDGRIAMP